MHYVGHGSTTDLRKNAAVKLIMEPCRLIGMCEVWKVLGRIPSGRTNFLRNGGVVRTLL